MIYFYSSSNLAYEGFIEYTILPKENLLQCKHIKYKSGAAVCSALSRLGIIRFVSILIEWIIESKSFEGQKNYSIENRFELLRIENQSTKIE